MDENNIPSNEIDARRADFCLDDPKVAQRVEYNLRGVWHRGHQRLYRLQAPIMCWVVYKPDVVFEYGCYGTTGALGVCLQT